MKNVHGTEHLGGCRDWEDCVSGAVFDVLPWHGSPHDSAEVSHVLSKGDHERRAMTSPMCRGFGLYRLRAARLPLSRDPS